MSDVGENEIIARLGRVEMQVGNMADTLDDVRLDMKAMRKLLWEGNGRTPLMQQVDLNRRTLQHHLERSKERRGRVSSRWWDLIRMILAAAIASLVSLMGTGAL